MTTSVSRCVRPSLPAPWRCIGLDALPEVGDNFQVVTDTAKAKQIVMYRESKAREQAMSKNNRITLEMLNRSAKEGDAKELNVIIKTDVGGTAEVLSEMLQKLSTEKVKIRVMAKNVGAITESDVLLASTSEAIIIGFNVRPERNAATLAEKEGVDIRLHTIIYELTDEIKKAMTGLLDPTFKEVFKGTGRGSRGIPDLQGRYRRRLLCHGRHAQPWQPAALDARQHRDSYGPDRHVEAIQGRCNGSEDRLRMRCHHRQPFRCEAR